MADQTGNTTWTGGSGEQSKQTTQTGGATTFTQAEVDRIVQDRLNRDRAKYADYEDLRNKVTEFEKHKEALTQQELEAKKEYEKLKDGWAQKENEYKTKLSEATIQLQGERINNALTNEILKKNAYPDAVALLRPMVKYNADGTMTISGKDANGMTSDIPLEQGVEQFLKDRPYLVKGSGQGGGGTGGSTGQGGTGEGQKDLGKLLQDAMRGGDRKSINDIKARIRAAHASKGIVSIL